MLELFNLIDSMCAYCRWFALNYPVVNSVLSVVYQLVTWAIFVRGTNLTERWMRWFIRAAGMDFTLEDMLSELKGPAKTLLLLILYP